MNITAPPTSLLKTVFVIFIIKDEMRKRKKQKFTRSEWIAIAAIAATLLVAVIDKLF